MNVDPVCEHSGVAPGVLWSVSTEIDFPKMYSQDRSHAHVSARAAFSIGAYLISVDVIARDMSETGRRELSGWS